MTKEKVLHIIANSNLGGAQSLVKDIVSNNQNHYIYSLKKTKLSVFESLPMEKIFYFDSYKFFKFNFKILFDLYRIIKHNNFQILHLHLVKPLIYSSLIKLLLPNLKIIYHEHGMIIGNDKNNKKIVWYPYYLKLFDIFINKYILISNFVEKEYQKINIKDEKLFLLENFVDFNKFNTISNRQLDFFRKDNNILKNEFVVGFGGRLIERKGWRDFLDAIVLLKNKGYKFKYIVVGDGEEKNEFLDKIKKRKLKKDIVYLGFQRDLSVFYSGVNIFCMPSHWEPLGLMQIEAQYFGIPVICTNVPGLVETVNISNSVIIECKKPEKIADSIIYIYNNKDIKKKLITGGFKNTKKFLYSNYMKKLQHIYEK